MSDEVQDAEKQEQQMLDDKYKSMGLDPEKVTEWKKMYGKVAKLTLGGETYVYRPIKRLEWKQLLDKVDKAEGGMQMLQEQTASRCVLHPPGFSSNLSICPAGVPSTLSDAVLKISGFQQEVEPEEL